jgi:hypothetical protein
MGPERTPADRMESAGRMSIRPIVASEILPHPRVPLVGIGIFIPGGAINKPLDVARPRGRVWHGRLISDRDTRPADGAASAGWWLNRFGR